LSNSFPNNTAWDGCDASILNYWNLTQYMRHLKPIHHFFQTYTHQGLGTRLLHCSLECYQIHRIAISDG